MVARAGWSGEVCSISSRAKVRGKGCGSLKVCWTGVRPLGILLQVGCEEHIGQEKAQAGKRLETQKHPKLDRYQGPHAEKCPGLTPCGGGWDCVSKEHPQGKWGHSEPQAGC